MKNETSFPVGLLQVYSEVYEMVFFPFIFLSNFSCGAPIQTELSPPPSVAENPLPSPTQISSPRTDARSASEDELASPEEFWTELSTFATCVAPCSDLACSPFPRGGIRSLGCPLQQFTGLPNLSSLSGVEIFLWGPHGTSSLSLEHPYDFGWYNPEFVAWAFDELLLGASAATALKRALPVYKSLAAPLARSLFAVAHKFENQPRCLADELEGYREYLSNAELEGNTGETYQSRFSSFLEPGFCHLDMHSRKQWHPDEERMMEGMEEGEGLPGPWLRPGEGLQEDVLPFDGRVVQSAAGFWLRRELDGSAPVFREGMERVMEAFDPEWSEAWRTGRFGQPTTRPIEDNLVFLGHYNGIRYSHQCGTAGAEKMLDQKRFWSPIVLDALSRMPLAEDGENFSGDPEWGPVFEALYADYSPSATPRPPFDKEVACREDLKNRAASLRTEFAWPRALEHLFIAQPDLLLTLRNEEQHFPEGFMAAVSNGQGNHLLVGKGCLLGKSCPGIQIQCAYGQCSMNRLDIGDAETAGFQLKDSSDAESHCRRNEDVYFSCRLGDGSNVSVCGMPAADPEYEDPRASQGDNGIGISPRIGRLRYVLGPIGAPEVQVEAVGWEIGRRFSYEEPQYVRSMGSKLEVQAGRTSHSVRSMIGSSHPGEAEQNNFKGIWMNREGSEKQLTCSGEPVDALGDLGASQE
jgi:hypothetical protein